MISDNFVLGPMEPPNHVKKMARSPLGNGGTRAFANSLPEGASALSGSLLKLPASRQAVRLFTPNGRVVKERRSSAADKLNKMSHFGYVLKTNP